LPKLESISGRGPIAAVHLEPPLGSARDLLLTGGVELAPTLLLRREQPQVALRVERAFAVSEILPLTGAEAAGFRNDAVTGYARPMAEIADRDETLSLLDTERLLRPFLSSSPVPGV